MRADALRAQFGHDLGTRLAQGGKVKLEGVKMPGGQRLEVGGRRPEPLSSEQRTINSRPQPGSDLPERRLLTSNF